MTYSFPTKVHMDDIITALGLSDNTDYNALKQILLLSKIGELPIYTETALNGALMSDSLEEIFDGYGNIDKVLVGQSNYFSGEELAIKLARPNGDNKVVVDHFKYRKEDYYSIDETSMWIEPTAIFYNALYCKGSDLNRYLRSKTSNSKNNKSIPILERREFVLRDILLEKAKLLCVALPDDSHTLYYQRLYELIGSPTRDEMLSYLLTANNDLFRTEPKTKNPQRNFFAKQGVIRFKDGTSKGR
jgi:hypothetical protein